MPLEGDFSLIQADRDLVHQVVNLLAAADHADKVVKGARMGLAWNVLLELVILLSGPSAGAGRAA